MGHARFVLTHRVRPVSPALSPHVEHLWMSRGYLPARWLNMILPDGAMELIVNLGDPQTLCAQDNIEKHSIFRHSWISGERIAPIVIAEIGHVHLVGVRLRAGGAWPFLGIPLREFTDQVVELDATRFVKRGMTIRDLICWIVAWSPASYPNELGVFDFALVALPNERKTSTNGGTVAPALSIKALVS